MPKLLISYYSRGGATRTMAELIAEGARPTGIDVAVKQIAETTTDDLLSADGIAIGSPTYSGAAAGPVRKLFDDSVKAHGRLDGKVGGAFTSSANIGGGNETTLLSIVQSMLVHGMVVQGVPQGDHYGPVSIGVPDKRATAQCKEFGKRLALLTLRLAASGA